MLAFITGNIVSKDSKGIVVENAGLGYLLRTTLATQSAVSLGEKQQFFISEAIKEDSYDLYGFLDTQTQALFELLCQVSGVGPKIALAILEIGKVQALQLAIIKEDKAYLAQATGIGLKVAGRICLDLKDKLKDQQLQQQADQGLDDSNQALLGLMALGLDKRMALTKLEGIDQGLDIEEQIKQALAK